MKADFRVRKQFEAIIVVAKVLCCKDLFALLCLFLHAGACVTGSKFNVDLQKLSGHVWRFDKDKQTIQMGITELFVSISQVVQIPRNLQPQT